MSSCHHQKLSKLALLSWIKILQKAEKALRNEGNYQLSTSFVKCKLFHI